jgi:hypothetical protein
MKFLCPEISNIIYVCGFNITSKLNRMFRGLTIYICILKQCCQQNKEKWFISNKWQNKYTGSLQPRNNNQNVLFLRGICNQHAGSLQPAALDRWTKMPKCS